MSRLFMRGRGKEIASGTRQSNCKEATAEVGQTPEEVAEMISISVAFYRRIEHGHAPSVRRLAQIAKSLDVSTDILLGVPRTKKPDKE